MYLIIPVIIITIIVGIAFGASSFKNVNIESGDFGETLKSFFFPSRRTNGNDAASAAPQPALQPPDEQQTAAPRQPTFTTLETAITQGPPEGFTLTKLATVTFEFSGTATPQSTQPISYETKIEGFDTDWQPTTSTSRTVTLPLQDKHYIFFVRSRLGNAVDPTPAQRSFNIAAF